MEQGCRSTSSGEQGGGCKARMTSVADLNDIQFDQQKNIVSSLKITPLILNTISEIFVAAY